MEIVEILSQNYWLFGSCILSEKHSTFLEAKVDNNRASCYMAKVIFRSKIPQVYLDLRSGPCCKNLDFQKKEFFLEIQTVIATPNSVFVQSVVKMKNFLNQLCPRRFHKNSGTVF